MFRQAARVNSLDANDLISLKIGPQVLRGPPIGTDAAGLFHDKTLHKRPRGLRILVVYPVIADQRVGHANHLPLIGGIRENLLITHETRIKNDFA